MLGQIVIDWSSPWVITVCVLLAVCVAFGIVGVVREKRSWKRRDRDWPGTGGF